MRAVALLSGGLDSTLAIKVIIEQGVDVDALNFRSIFCTCTPKNRSCSVAASAARQLGVNLKIVNTTPDFLEIVKNPKHGYGRNLNPCLDCRILMFRKAGEYMRQVGASFLVTGEVLGERPMSQRRDAMRLIELEAGLEGLIVRPLSAGLLEPSLPERRGWIDRNKLLGISGRCRKSQMGLARFYGMNDYPCPAGGCRLTDPGFARRMKDLVEHVPNFTVNDVYLLIVGRHFRLGPSVKAVVGRNEEENKRLFALRIKKDRVLEVLGFPGPLTLVRGNGHHGDLYFPAAITARYSKANGQAEIEVNVSDGDGTQMEILRVGPVDEKRLAGARI